VKCLYIAFHSQMPENFKEIFRIFRPNVSNTTIFGLYFYPEPRDGCLMLQKTIQRFLPVSGARQLLENCFFIFFKIAITLLRVGEESQIGMVRTIWSRGSCICLLKCSGIFMNKIATQKI
jgi:hypothetical protein